MRPLLKTNTGNSQCCFVVLTAANTVAPGVKIDPRYWGVGAYRIPTSRLSQFVAYVFFNMHQVHFNLILFPKIHRSLQQELHAAPAYTPSTWRDTGANTRYIRPHTAHPSTRGSSGVRRSIQGGLGYGENKLYSAALREEIREVRLLPS